MPSEKRPPLESRTSEKEKVMVIKRGIKRACIAFLRFCLHACIDLQLTIRHKESFLLLAPLLALFRLSAAQAGGVALAYDRSLLAVAVRSLAVSPVQCG